MVKLTKLHSYLRVSNMIYHRYIQQRWIAMQTQLERGTIQSQTSFLKLLSGCCRPLLLAPLLVSLASFHQNRTNNMHKSNSINKRPLSSFLSQSPSPITPNSLMTSTDGSYNTSFRASDHFLLKEITL